MNDGLAEAGTAAVSIQDWLEQTKTEGIGRPVTIACLGRPSSALTKLIDLSAKIRI